MRLTVELLNSCPVAVSTRLIFDDNGETSQLGKIAQTQRELYLELARSSKSLACILTAAQ